MAVAHEERLRLAEQLRLRDRTGASAAGQLGELQAELQQRDAQLQAERQRVARSAGPEALVLQDILHPHT